MYANGIRKIFEHQGHYGSLEELIKFAEEADYEALVHNGDIYMKIANAWYRSLFHIRDFE